jgi:hypothetical protein
VMLVARNSVARYNADAVQRGIRLVLHGTTRNKEDWCCTVQRGIKKWCCAVQCGGVARWWWLHGGAVNDYCKLCSPRFFCRSNMAIDSDSAIS